MNKLECQSNFKTRYRIEVIVVIFVIFSVNFLSCKKAENAPEIIFEYVINGVTKSKNDVTTRMFSNFSGNMILIYGENNPYDDESMLIDLDSNIVQGEYAIKRNGSNNDILLILNNKHFKSRTNSGVIRIINHDKESRTISGQFFGMLYDDIVNPKDSFDIQKGVFKVKY